MYWLYKLGLLAPATDGDLMMHLIKAIDPADLMIQVNEQITKGYDLHTAPFVSEEGLICQRMVPFAEISAYEYRLVIAHDLDDLYNQENNAIEMGFEYSFSTVLWHGKYLQWMFRTKIINSAFSDTIFENALRADERRLVEDVRALLHMEPTALGGYLVRVPNPVMGS